MPKDVAVLNSDCGHLFEFDASPMPGMGGGARDVESRHLLSIRSLVLWPIRLGLWSGRALGLGRGSVDRAEIKVDPAIAGRHLATM